MGYSMFFLETILVPPIKFRAPTKGGDSVSTTFNNISLFLFKREGGFDKLGQLIYPLLHVESMNDGWFHVL